MPRDPFAKLAKRNKSRAGRHKFELKQRGTGATHWLCPFSMGGRSAMASLIVTVRRGAPAGRLVSTAQ
jgi:hypothetical protein